MKTIFSIIVCIFLSIGFIAAQETAAEWLEEASLAESENRTTDAASAYSNAAHKQMESGDYEAAAENFKKAAEQFRNDGRIAQANAETTNAAGAYEAAAKNASENGEHEKAAELYEKAAELYDADGRSTLAEGARRKADNERQNLIVTSNPRGTGQTTGHIATLNVTNNSSAPITINSQIFYIPSNSRYQSYVGRIPKPIDIKPGETLPIEITGYCTDVTKPPSAENLPPLAEWVSVNPSINTEAQTPHLVGDPPEMSESNPVSLIPGEPQAVFNPSHIPDILGSGAYSSNDSKDQKDIVATWPGTEIPFGGTLDPEAEPDVIAPVVVSIVESIEKAIIVIQDDPEISTPFSNNKEREFEALAQQTIWMVMADLTGADYEKKDFAENTYEQYSSVREIPVASISEEVKEKLDEGVDDFWAAFTAVGVEAKVIKAEEKVDDSLNTKEGPDPINDLVAYLSPKSMTLYVDADYLDEVLISLNAESMGKGEYQMTGVNLSGKDMVVKFKVSGAKQTEIYNIAENEDKLISGGPDFVNEFKVGATSYKVYKNAVCGVASEAFTSECDNLKDGSSSQREWLALRKCEAGKGFCTLVNSVGGYNHIYELSDCKGPRKSSQQLLLYQCWQ